MKTKKQPFVGEVRKGRSDMTTWDMQEGCWCKSIYDDGCRKIHMGEKLPRMIAKAYGSTQKRAHEVAQYIEDAIREKRARAALQDSREGK